MSFDPVTALIDLGKTAIDKIFPDAESKQKRIQRLEELAHAGDMVELEAEVKLLTGQMAINVEEAKHPSVFVSGWRPAVGWCGVFAMAYQFIAYPVLTWFIDNPPPVIEAESLEVMLYGMLGLGAMRSHDKWRGVDTKRQS